MKAAGLKRGVVIVMNPQTGEILAMVSLPTYDDNLFARGISAKDYKRAASQPRQAAPQPRDRRALPARLDLQARDRDRRARRPQDHREHEVQTSRT
jgi:cell division protein FtsI/penicillin-binding protein 2